MKSKIKTILMAAMLCASLLAQAQQPIGFDLRGRDCNGGLGICSANKTSGPNNNISIEKTGQSTFVLTILRNSLTETEEDQHSWASIFKF